ncbi:hypothetical protein T10_3408 [Trichinella papuae]|uniref:Uncharacterized protein n=1 Tax=Trichinella papuae TaxID=268474 RepID=A0A0V1MR34_9BILA|nr:hypothetical protein T10_3408 [Trichinella papuae]
MHQMQVNHVAVRAARRVGETIEVAVRSTLESTDTPLEPFLLSHQSKGTYMRPYLLGEDSPASTSFRCLPVFQPGSDENAAVFPLVRRGDSVRPPIGCSETFLVKPPIRRTLLDTSAFPWCTSGTPRGEAATTFSPACLILQPIIVKVRLHDGRVILVESDISTKPFSRAQYR